MDKTCQRKNRKTHKKLTANKNCLFDEMNEILDIRKGFVNVLREMKCIWQVC